MRRNEMPIVALYVLLVLWLLLARALGGKAQTMHLEKPFGVVEYSPELRIPKMVEWVIMPRDLKRVARRGSWRFKADYSVPAPRATHDDYTNSGYQRGHMCPAADRVSSLALMKSTFLMTNVCPQAPALNVGRWKMTEELCRQGARTYGSCTVRVAPLFLFQDTAYLGIHKVAIPHAFFKVAWCHEKQKIIGMWIMYNR